MSVKDLDLGHLETEFASILTVSAPPHVKKPAIEYFLGLTGTDEGKMFIGSSNKFIKSILDLTEDPDDAMVKASFETLINLATLDSTCQRILKCENCSNVIITNFEKIMDPKYKHADLVCKFLSNLTRSEECAQKVAEIIKETDKVNIVKLVTIMCTKDYNSDADLHYLAPILANLGQSRHIRDEILNKDQWVIQRLLPFVSYMESDIRRLGVVSCIKNCCFDEGEYFNKLQYQRNNNYAVYEYKQNILKIYIIILTVL